MSSNTKKSCPVCNKEYTQKTLLKYNGKCGKCSKANGIVGSKSKLVIPKKIKAASWMTYVGDTLKGNCYACSTPIEFTDFHAGHIQSEYDGGKITSDNIRPICKSCNLSCGVMNLDNFKKKLNVTEVKTLEVKDDTNDKTKWLPIISSSIELDPWLNIGGVNEIAYEIFKNKVTFASWKAIYEQGGTIEYNMFCPKGKKTGVVRCERKSGNIQCLPSTAY